MTSLRVALEQFDLRVEPEPDTAPPAPPAAVAVAEAPLPEPEAEPEALGEHEAMAEANAAAVALTQHLASLLAAMDRSRNAASAAVAAALGAAAEAVLPHLASSGFAAEVAAATQQLIRVGGERRVALRLAPGIAEEVSRALATASPPLPVDVTVDPSLGVGDAYLDWTDGGAVIAADRLIADAQALLSRRLGELTLKELS